MPQIIGDPDQLMTAVDHLARSDADEIRQRAENKAEQIRDEAQQRAGRKREEILQKARSQIKEMRKKRRVKVSRKVTRNYLNEREALLDEVWKQAESRLRSLTDESSDYADVLKQLALSAARILGPGELALAADAKGHKLLTRERREAWSREAEESLEASFSFARAEDPLDIWGGLMVTDQKTRRRVDSTFPTRLELAKDEIRGEVLRQLVES